MSIWKNASRNRDLPIQPGRGIPPRPSLRFVPSPGTPDWLEIANDHIDALAQKIDGVEFYHTQWMRSVDGRYPENGPNTLTYMRSLNLVPQLMLEGIEIALDAPAYKPWSEDPDAYIAQTLDAIEGIESAGGVVHEIVWDEPFNAGLRMDPIHEFRPIVMHCLIVKRQLKEFRPNLRVLLCEPYPSLTLLEISDAITMVAPDGFHLDVDYRAVKQQGGIAALQNVLQHLGTVCDDRGIPFGVIIWGCEETTDATFMQSAKHLFAAVQDGVHQGKHQWPDRLIVQSWSDTAKEPRIVPRTLPPDGATSLWGLLQTVEAGL